MQEPETNYESVPEYEDFEDVSRSWEKEWELKTF